MAESRFKNLGVKFKRIFLPVPVASVLIAGILVSLDWLLITRWTFVPLRQDLAVIVAPMGTAAAFVMLFVARRVRLLKFKKDNARTFYNLVAAAAIFAPALTALIYVDNVAGDITHVRTASDVAAAADTRFYSTDSTCVDISRATGQTILQREGAHDEGLGFTLYVAIPICGQSPNSRPTKQVWLGLTYHQSIATNLDDAGREEAYRSFLRTSQNQLNALNTKSYRYFQREGMDRNTSGFDAALRRAGTNIGSSLVLIPHTESFSSRGGKLIQWAGFWFVAITSLWFSMVMFAKLNSPDELATLEEEVRSSRKGMRFVFFPSWENYGFPLLFWINVLVFLTMMISAGGAFSFDGPTLLAWGANYAPDLHGWGLIRLITCQFVHESIMHLLTNMYGLFFCGVYLMMFLRSSWFIGCYLVTGLAASVTSALVHPEMFSIGASGSIFGLCGILIAFLVLIDSRLITGRVPVLINISIFVGLNLLYGLKAPMVDNAAHIGGLVAGLILGAVIHFTYPPQPLPEEQSDLSA